MQIIRQSWSLLRMNLASIPQRPGLALTILIGIMSAVGVLVSMLALGVGARREIMANVRPDRVVLMSSDTSEPMQSRIRRPSHSWFTSSLAFAAMPEANRSPCPKPWF